MSVLKPPMMIPSNKYAMPKISEMMAQAIPSVRCFSILFPSMRNILQLSSINEKRFFLIDRNRKGQASSRREKERGFVGKESFLSLKASEKQEPMTIAKRDLLPGRKPRRLRRRPLRKGSQADQELKEPKKVFPLRRRPP
jgi:hypothetical protein